MEKSNLRTGEIPIICSTGAFLGRVNNCNPDIIPQLCPQLPCENFEFMLFERWRISGETGVITEKLNESGISFPVVHSEKKIGDLTSSGLIDEAKKIFSENCAAASDLGAELIVMHLWGYPESDKNFKANLTAYKEFEKISDSSGLILAVENIPCISRNPLDRHMELLQSYPDIKFTFDTRMAAFHKQLDAAYGESGREYWKNVAHVHFSSYQGGLCEWERLSKILHPGEGEVGLKELFLHLKAVNYGGAVTLESPVMSNVGIDTEKLKDSINLLISAAQD